MISVDLSGINSQGNTRVTHFRHSYNIYIYFVSGPLSPGISWDFNELNFFHFTFSLCSNSKMASQRGIGLRWNLLAFCKQTIALSILAITGRRHRHATCRVVACQICAHGNKALRMLLVQQRSYDGLGDGCDDWLCFGSSVRETKWDPHDPIWSGMQAVIIINCPTHPSIGKPGLSFTWCPNNSIRTDLSVCVLVHPVTWPDSNHPKYRDRKKSRKTNNNNNINPLYNSI